MKAPEIDKYISKFEELCNKAGYTMGNTEVTLPIPQRPPEAYP
jgi:hypothetical protein